MNTNSHVFSDRWRLPHFACDHHAWCAWSCGCGSTQVGVACKTHNRRNPQRHTFIQSCLRPPKLHKSLPTFTVLVPYHQYHPLNLSLSSRGPRSCLGLVLVSGVSQLASVNPPRFCHCEYLWCHLVDHNCITHWLTIAHYFLQDPALPVGVTIRYTSPLRQCEYLFASNINCWF